MWYSSSVYILLIHIPTILDRIVHNAIRLPLKGGSLRKLDVDGDDSAGTGK